MAEQEDDFVANVSGASREAMLERATELALVYYAELPGTFRAYYVVNPHWDDTDSKFHASVKFKYNPEGKPATPQEDPEETEDEREERLSQLQRVHHKS